MKKAFSQAIRLFKGAGIAHALAQHFHFTVY
jgi:hypothetical protein